MLPAVRAYLDSQMGIKLTMLPSFKSASIVVLGKFLPEKFTPEALSSEGVIPIPEANRAKYLSLLKGPAGVTQFRLSWGEITVTPDRLTVSAERPPFVRACDVVRKALFESPAHTIIRAFGINLEAHFDLGNREAVNKLGRKFAPPDAWGTWGTEIENSMKDSHSLRNGGMMLLQMRMPFFDDDIIGFRDVQVLPSNRIKRTGVCFVSNHHHESAKNLQEDGSVNTVVEEKEAISCDFALEVLGSKFEQSIAEAESIFDEVLL